MSKALQDIENYKRKILQDLYSQLSDSEKEQFNKSHPSEDHFYVSSVPACKLDYIISKCEMILERKFNKKVKCLVNGTYTYEYYTEEILFVDGRYIKPLNDGTATEVFPLCELTDEQFIAINNMNQQMVDLTDKRNYVERKLCEYCEDIKRGRL